MIEDQPTTVGSSRLRGRVAIISSHWGEAEDEQITVTRLIAGALARHFEVDVLHLHASATTSSVRAESAFRVHTFPLSQLGSLQGTLLRVAMSPYDVTAQLPDYLQTKVDQHTNELFEVIERIDELNPDAIVLCGTVHPYDLDRLRGNTRRRIVFIPLTTTIARVRDRAVGNLVAQADLICALHPGELRTLVERFPDRARDIVALDVALSVNRNAMNDTLFGVRFFLPFALLIRSFPADGPRFDHAVSHEIITSVAGKVQKCEVPEESWRTVYEDVCDELPLSVAEVDGDNWRLSDNINMLPLPVSPSRINLWRLMAHALFMVDLRPPSAFGRETIESFMFATPVIVPDDSAAMEHAASANAGLWYRDAGELLDSVRVMTDRRVREEFGRNGRAYAEAHHSDMPGFVERIAELVMPTR